MLLTLVVVFIIGFRVLNSPTRRATGALTKRLNIDPVYVESLLSLMGRNAGEEFIAYLSQDTEARLSNAASVLLIWQLFLVDDSEENTAFWRGVLREAWLPTELASEHVRLALKFLRDLEPDAQEMHAFRLRYNARFASDMTTGERGGDNVVSIHSHSHYH